MNRTKLWVCLALLHWVLPVAFSENSSGMECSIEENQNKEKKQPLFLSVDYKDLSDAEIYASKLYSRLAGVSISLRHPRFKRVVRYVERGEYLLAAQQVVKDPSFLNVRVRNFAAPFSSKTESITDPFNDLHALIIGIVRDGEDARLLLNGDFGYQGSRSSGLPQTSISNNAHYVAFEENGLDFVKDLVKVQNPYPELGVASGAFSTRAWAEEFYDMGTNRRAVKHTTELFLCSSIETWKTRGVPDSFVRRDVERTPSEDPAIYQNLCRSCHGFMDAVGGAFAKFDFVEGEIVYHKVGVADKMNNLPDVYPEGNITVDDSWSNLYNHSTEDFGWRGEGTDRGLGIKSFATALSNTRSFSTCMTKRIFREVCGFDVTGDSDYESVVDELADGFEADEYNLKNLFSSTASRAECIEQ